MMPDLPTFLGLTDLRALTHRWTSVPVLDAGVTLLLVLAWFWGLRPVVADLVPTLAGRWVPPRPWRSLSIPGGVGRALAWYGSAAFGVLTHVAWDSCTHADGLAVSWLPVLSEPVAGTALYNVLQVGTSVLGLGILAWWARRWWRSTATAVAGLGPGRSRRAQWRLLRAGLVVIGAALLVGFAVAVPQAMELRGLVVWRVLVGRTLFVAGGIVLAVVVVAVVGHRVVRPRPFDATHEDRAKDGLTL